MADTTTPSQIAFDTDSLPERDRLSAFREIYGRTILKHDIEATGDLPFRFAARMFNLPGLGLATSVISPCLASRGPHLIDDDDFILGICVEGGGSIRQVGREAVIGPREAVLTANAEPSRVVIPVTSRRISLRIPGAIIRSRVADVDAVLSRRIADCSALRLLTDYVGLFERIAAADPSLRGAAAAHMHTLACLVLGQRSESQETGAPDGPRAAYRAAILQAIANGSGDASLSAVTIAAALGISPRYVHLLLEETGKSFTRHLLERRLECAAALLRDPRWRDRRITEIAAKAGFNDLSYFNRTFRRHLGASPSDIRRS